MEALLAHRGAVVHVNHSHRLQTRARTGSMPSAPRGHHEVPTATEFNTVLKVGWGDMPADVWENMLDKISDCLGIEEVCKKLNIICKSINLASPCNLPDFWKSRCKDKGWLFKDPNYVPYNVDDAESIDRWRRQYWLFCLASKKTGSLWHGQPNNTLENLINLGDGGIVPVYSFADCRFMDLERLPETITSIGDLAFTGCINLALTILPEKVTSIGYGAFSGCSALALTKLPVGITILKTRVFQDCTNLALESLPEGIFDINSYAFEDCKNLKLTHLPQELTRIGHDAFSGCTELVLRNLPDKIVDIGPFAFEGCSKCQLGNTIGPTNYFL